MTTYSPPTVLPCSSASDRGRSLPLADVALHLRGRLADLAKGADK